MNQAQLARAIEGGAIPGLLLLYGVETFLLERAVKGIVDKLVPTDARDFNLSVFDGREAGCADILDAVRTLPVFAPHRLVLVKDCQHLKADTLEGMLPYIKDPVPETTLLLTADKIDGRKKFYQHFKKAGEHVEFKGIYDNQLPAFVREQARLSGVTFTEEAMALFCRRVGTNLQEVHGELVKLKTYLGQGNLIDTAEVEAVVSDTRVESIFDLTNAVGQRNREQALRLFQRMLDEGEPPLRILSMLVRHFRQLWKARDLMRQGVAKNALPKALGINPYFIDGVLAQARHFSHDQCRRAFDIFLQADLALKSSGAHPSAMLEQVLLQLMAGEGRRGQ